MLKFDLHIHSHYSFDSMNKPDEIVKTAIKKGLAGIAITDHNVFRIDWENLQNKYPDLIIIPGMEIGTRGVGDILCYFIKDEITTKDPFKVIEQVHEQGGIAVLAHPFHHGRTETEYPDKLMELLDGVEIGNAHNSPNFIKSLELAEKFSIPTTGGSDAHLLSEIGNGGVELEMTRENARNEKRLKQAILNGIVSECETSRFLLSYSFTISQSVKYARKIHLLDQKQ